MPLSVVGFNNHIFFSLTQRRRLLHLTRTSLLRRAYNSRHTSGQAHQVQNESIAQYVRRLCWLGEHCDFDKYSLDEAIKDQLIEHCHSTTLSRCLLREKSTASLNSLLDIARSMELANFQAVNIENASSQERSENTHQLTMPTVSEEDQANFPSEKQQRCTHYGNQHDHQRWTPRCPAFLRTCS